MSSKTAPMSFQPAPRPRPRASPEQTRELAEATRDLGFGRTTSTPAEAPAGTELQEAASPAAAAIVAKVAPRSMPAKPANAQPTLATASPPDKMATLKVAMPDDIWNALRLEALNRRVTVKFLVMEALAAKGYDIDLSQVAEDGRRLR